MLHPLLPLPPFLAELKPPFSSALLMLLFTPCLYIIFKGGSERVLETDDETKWLEMSAPACLYFPSKLVPKIGNDR